MTYTWVLRATEGNIVEHLAAKVLSPALFLGRYWNVASH